MRDDDLTIVAPTPLGVHTRQDRMNGHQRAATASASSVAVPEQRGHRVTPAVHPAPNACDDLAAAVRARTPTAYERWFKPVVDRIAAAVLLVLAMPVLLVLTMAVLMSIGWPLLYRQQRIGRNGTPFEMLKFRTMLPDRRVSQAPYFGLERRRTHKSPHDPRHTRLGRLMRKTSLDELPQLFNVLAGDMSLVGPRPEMASIVESFVPWQHSRHVVKPGLTGLWQTTARGDGRLLHECIELDLHYISLMSFRSDLMIMLRTPIALLRSREVV